MRQQAKRKKKSIEIHKMQSNWTKFKETFVLLENLMKIQSDYSLWMNFVRIFQHDKYGLPLQRSIEQIVNDSK